MEKNKSKVKIFIIISVITLVSLIIAGVIFRQLKTNERQQDVTEILEELYHNARKVYLENGFKYKDKMETVKFITITDTEVEGECYQILNYDEVLDKVFTKNGKIQYEEKMNTKSDGALIYVDGKVYGGMFGYSGDIDYKTTEFINIRIEPNTISCTARNIYYSEERDNIENDFVIKNVNGQWLVEEYSNEW